MMPEENRQNHEPVRGPGARALREAGARPAAPLVDYEGLRASNIWAEGCAPDIRTLQRWVRGRRIPYLQMGRLVRFDVEMVREHIYRSMMVQPVGVPRTPGGHPRSGNVRMKALRALSNKKKGEVDAQ